MDLVYFLSDEELEAGLRSGELKEKEQIIFALTQIAEQDLALALNLLREIDLGLHGKEVEKSVVEFLAWHDPHGTLDVFQEWSPSQKRSTLVLGLLTAWLSDEERADEAMEKLPLFESLTGKHGRHLAGTILTDWATLDYDAAEDWVQNKADPKRRGKFLNYLLVGKMYSTEDKADAVDMALNDPQNSTAQMHLRFAFLEWSAKDPATALGRMADIPQTHSVWLSSRDIGYNMIKENPTVDPVALAGLLPEGKYHRQFLFGVVDRAKDHHLESVPAILEGIPESKERNDAVKLYTEILLRDDPENFHGWLEGLEETPSRDHAVSRYVELIADSDPALAREWVGKINNVYLREAQQLK